MAGAEYTQAEGDGAPESQGTESLAAAPSVTCDSGHNLRHKGNKIEQEIFWRTCEGPEHKLSSTTKG